MSGGLLMSRRIRRTPYTNRVEAAGVRGFTVVNHMLLPKAFQHSVEEDYWHLCEHVQIWDVSTQRQVEIKGPDAAKLVQWMTPRDLSNAKAGQCLYVPLVDENAGMVNDPVLLKLADDHFWLSIADSDVLLWAKGLAAGAGLKTNICEPDVFPLAIQGPKAEAVLEKIFGEAIKNVGFFKFDFFEFEGTSQLIARSGYSKQGGFEIYLKGAHLGEKLWDVIFEAGKEFDIRPGCPNLIERIEGGLLSYGNEFNLENNPLECGLEAYCSLDANIEFLARDALEAIHKKGIERLMRGVLFEGPACPPCGEPWPIMADGLEIGQITSAIWSPKFKLNIGLSMIEKSHWNDGQVADVLIQGVIARSARIVNLPLEQPAQGV